MVYRYSYRIILIILILFACNKNNTNYPHKYHRAPFSEEELYDLQSNKNIPEKIIINYPKSNIHPYSGTVSHHLLVSPIINKWFEILKEKREIETFIILCPRHFNLSQNNICISSLDWKMNNEIIRTNKKYIKQIKKYMNLQEDPFAFHKEHGISALLPFINKYFPDAQIVPIAMDEFNKQIGQCYKLSEIISKIIKKDKDTFLLVSVDFSHKAGRQETDKRDLISENILYTLEKNKVNNIYSDNNVGLITLFSVCEKQDIKNTYILNHTDAEIFTGINLKNDITSYIFTYQY